MKTRATPSATVIVSVRPGIPPAVAAEPPGAESRVLTHRDFCGGNMAITPEGRLRAVGTKHTATDAAGLDLARSWYRWGVRGTHWDWLGNACRAGGRKRQRFCA